MGAERGRRLREDRRCGREGRAPLADSAFGRRDGGIRGPFGNIWWVVTQVEDVPEDVMWARLQEPVCAEQMRVEQETFDAEMAGRAQGRSSAPVR
jgi:PhnB protein